MFEFTDNEWEEIERGPFGEIIEKMSRVHGDLTTMKNEEKNLFRGAQFFGMSRVVESAAILLFETQRRITALEHYHQTELQRILLDIVNAVSGRIESLDQEAVDEIQSYADEATRLLAKKEPS